MDVMCAGICNDFRALKTIDYLVYTLFMYTQKAIVNLIFCGRMPTKKSIFGYASFALSACFYNLFTIKKANFSMNSSKQ